MAMITRMMQYIYNYVTNEIVSWASCSLLL